MQFLPVTATETVIREISYALPDDRREMRAARHLNWRINRRVNAEDTELIGRVQLGMQSPSYRPGPLGTSHHASVRRRTRGQPALRRMCVSRTRQSDDQAFHHGMCVSRTRQSDDQAFHLGLCVSRTGRSPELRFSRAICVSHTDTFLRLHV